jgi:hypothetical protein
MGIQVSDYVSSLADPRPRADECERAQTAICPYHGGLIATQPTQHDHEGDVYFCPIGGMYWRYTRQRHKGLKPLRWKWRFH